MAVLPERVARYGLTIHPSKTTLIAFRKPATAQGAAPGNGTFDFLGLTHDWTKSRRGYWMIKRRTARKRLLRTKKALWRWCRANRHAPLKAQYRRLCLKLRGHFQYYGIRGNFPLLDEVRRYAEKAWRYWLSRRSSKSAIGGEKFKRLQPAGDLQRSVRCWFSNIYSHQARRQGPKHSAIAQSTSATGGRLRKGPAGSRSVSGCGHGQLARRLTDAHGGGRAERIESACHHGPGRDWAILLHDVVASPLA